MTTPVTSLTPRSGRGLPRGWCPGVADPMESGDGWLLRIRVQGGVVTANELRTVATVSARFGSGLIDVTSRANLQIRGLRPGTVDGAADALVAAGLASGDARTDACRSVVASPFADHDPTASRNVTPLVDEIVGRLVAALVGSLPSKFGVVVDDGGAWCLDGVDADVRLVAGRGGWSVVLRGQDEPIGWTDDPVRVSATVGQLCAGRAERMDAVVASIGRPATAELLGVVPGHSRASTTTGRRTPARRTLGRVPHIDSDRCNVVAAPFLGRVDADLLTEIARLTVHHGSSLRLTTDHSFAFCSVRDVDASSLMRCLEDLGLSVDASDPRAMVSACVGSLGCASAHADTASAAARMALTARASTRVHLSACAKGCGAPAGVPHVVADGTGAFR